MVLAQSTIPDKHLPTGSPATSTTLLQISAPSQAKTSPLFEALVVPPTEQAVKHVKRAEEYAARVGLLTCMRNSLSWALRAGSAELTVRTITAISSAALPYGFAVGAAKITDALIKLDKDPSAATTAIEWFVSLGALGLVATGLNLLDRWNSARHQMRLNHVLLRDVREAVTSFSPAKQLTPEVAQDVGRVLMSKSVVASFGEKIINGFVPIVSVLGAVTIVASYSPWAAVALAGFVPLQLMHMRRLGKDKITNDFNLGEVYSRFNSREWGMLSGPAAVEIALYGKVEKFLEHLDSQRVAIDERERELDLKHLKRELWLQPFNQIVILGLGLSLLNDALSGSVSSVGNYGFLAGALYTANSSFRSLASSIGEVVREFPIVRTAIGIMHAARETRSTEETIRPATTGTAALFEQAPTLSVRNLTYSYPANKGEAVTPTLKNISFDVRSGEFLGIVGPSGCGKTTLTSLLCGLNDPDPGVMLISGHCISQIPRRQLWGNSAYLRQKTSNLYSMTLRENIRLGEAKPLSDEEIMAVADVSGFSVFMREKGWTLDTVLGSNFEKGIDLSGGQSTLLAMARAEATKAKLLVLDEPTAALDQPLADKVLDRLMAMTDVTRLVISHDYGIARHADRILVLSQGEVVDLGTHDELMSRCNLYADGFNSQLDRLKQRSN